MPRVLIPVTVAVVFAVATPAHAAQVDSFNNSSIVVTDQSQAAQLPPDALARVGAAGPAQPVYTYWAVGWAGDRFCRVRRVTTDAALADGYNFALHHGLAAANALGSAAECPTTPGAPPAVLAPPSPDTLARSFWDVRILPTPTLTIVPDYAICGKPVYLQIGGERTKHFDVPDPLGPPVSIDATAQYLVDWGDGSPLQTTMSHGGPWPTGDVRHTYTTMNPAQVIRVSERWSATWSAGDQHGTLDDLHTDASLTFRVTQVQAVRN